MNVFYEEDGGFKVGAVMSSTDASLQVEAPHGKRSKIKTAHVLLKFTSPLADFLPQAETAAADIDVDFLWECCGADEFQFEALAADYWGHAPSAIEAAAIALRLHGAPMYFYRKGRGHYKAAPEDTLKAALAGQEKRRQQQLQIDEWAAQLRAGNIPEALRSQLMTLLHRPDKNTLEWKALDAASRDANQPPLRLVAAAGGIPSVPDYLLAGFLMEHFPKGRGFSAYAPAQAPGELVDAGVQAFSIDDAATTEIDDAFSLTRLDSGNWRVGVHIAAPTLGIGVDSELEKLVYNRLSTVYFPGDKITMLPDDAVNAFTLKEGQHCPAVSMYLEVAPDFTVLSHESRVEQVFVAANLRHDTLEPLFNEDTLANDPGVDYPYKAELRWLWEFANALEVRRGKADPTRPPQLDYNFAIEDGKVIITRRKRGAPMDKLVSELMILVNCEWGGELDRAGFPAIYRAQTQGKVKMVTTAQPHVGLGVAQYAWSSSPLRRAVDFVNQRQLVAMIRGEPAAFPPGDARLYAILRDFDAAYSAYNQFQDQMERFWCLRWFTQEGVSEPIATYVKEDLVRIDGLPMATRLSGLPDGLQAGDKVRLAIVRIDELTLDIEYRVLGRLDGAAPEPVALDDAVDDVADTEAASVAEEVSATDGAAS